MTMPFFRRAGGLHARAGVANANPAPTDIALSAATIAPGAASGTVVGTLSVTDPGEATWSFAISNGNTKFALSAGSGATVQLLRGLSGTLTDGVPESVQITVTDGAGGQRVETFSITVGTPGASFTVPIGIRNYGGSSVASGATIQFGVPVDQARAIAAGALTLAMTRDSDGTVIPVQMDLASTTRVGGNLAYFVATARVPFAVAATTTIPCTLTITPGGSYSPGADAVTLAQLNARDFRVEATGGDITGTGVANLTSTGSVYCRQIKSGPVCAWEGFSLIRVGGTGQGYWGVRWRAEAAADTAVSDWRIDATVYCSSVDGTPFASNKGRTITTTVKAGATVLNNAAAFTNVWVSGFTGFKIYDGTDSRKPAYGGNTLRPVHNRDALVAAKAVWPFRWLVDTGGDGNGSVGSWTDAYVPGSIAGFRTTWAGTGVDGTIGPLSSVSYKMLRDTADDALWKQGYDAGLKHLSVGYHVLHLATGFARPQFGSYAGMAAADGTQISGAQGTYNSSNASIMTAETGHYCDTAFIPALLTGEMAFIDGLAAVFGTKVATEQPAYFSPQLSGRPRRNLPYMNPGYGLERYSCWPQRQLSHFCALADDGRPDKAYGRAITGETAAFAVDCYVDFLPWTSTGTGGGNNTPPISTAFDGNKVNSTTNGWALGLRCFNNVNAGPISGAFADAPWCHDFETYVLWLEAARNGETYVQAVHDAFLTRHIIGRAMGAGACVSYSATFAPIVAYPDGTLPQTWTDYWQKYNDGSGSVATRTVCPTTITPAGADGGAGVPAGYRNALRLLETLGFAGAHGATYASARAAVDACFSAGAADWEPTIGNREGRWLVAMS